MNQTQIIETVHRLLAEAGDQLGMTFPVPPITFKLRGTSCAGQHAFTYNRLTGEVKNHQLKFNMGYLAGNPEAFMRVTVPHEVAHYIDGYVNGYTKGSSHTYYWKRIMRSVFGLMPDVTIKYEVDYSKMPQSQSKRQTRWTYKCSCRTMELSTTRHNKLRRSPTAYSCGKCQSFLKFVG
jgi:SprT protein